MLLTFGFKVIEYGVADPKTVLVQEHCFDIRTDLCAIVSIDNSLSESCKPCKLIQPELLTRVKSIKIKVIVFWSKFVTLL
jgi:hypothetical protein